MPNRLTHETSPYLRQHADNPVDWHPYGAEAFARAKADDRPILLSIGYSACHWCHVMAHESFEDEATAQLMNERFVNVKVDREELPDVDQVYQRALQLQGESGGWPLTMFLTPDGVPFFGGTYFPPDDRYGRPSFRRVLGALSDAWTKDRAGIVGQSGKYLEGLRQVGASERAAGEGALDDAALDRAIAQLATRVDRTHGGFGGAPKFPNPSALRLLLRGARRARRRGEDGAELEGAALLALEKMADGGIYDQAGGGFARYSTDAVWLVPHFEKMLYDNAQLLSLYAEAQQRSPHARWERVLRGTAAFIERELTAPSGALHTALDADSEGLEGRFYVWTWDELAAVLDEDELALAERLLGASRGGNWRDPHGHSPPGANVLSLAAPPRDEAERARRDAILARLFTTRAPRPRPGTDDKVLASVNGLAIAGLARAGHVLADATMIASARRVAAAVLDTLRDARTGRLRRTWKDGEARLPGTLDDHAFCADGLFALYEATGEARWFDAAVGLVEVALGLFWDADEALFYLTAAEEPELPATIERPLSSHDGAIPAGASVLIDRLLTVGEALGERRWVEIGERALRRRAGRALEQPFAYAQLLGALDTLLEGPIQLVLGGDDPGALERAAATTFAPTRFLVRAADAPRALHLLVADKEVGPARAYVCRQQRCDVPASDPTELVTALSN